MSSRSRSRTFGGAIVLFVLGIVCAAFYLIATAISDRLDRPGHPGRLDAPNSTASASDAGEVKILVELDRAVEESDLRDYCAVIAPGDGRSLNFQVRRADSEGKLFSFVFDAPAARVTLRAGLPSRDGKSALERDRVYDYPSAAFIPLARTAPSNGTTWTSLDHDFLKGVGWSELKNSEQEVKLTFVDSVDPDLLRDSLTLYEGERPQPLEYELKRGDLTRFHYVRIGMENPAEARLRLVLKAGLEDVTGVRLQNDIERKLERSLPPLSIDNSRVDNFGPTLSLALNRPFSSETLAESLAIDPPEGELKVSGYGLRHRVQGEWRSNADYTLTIPAGTIDADGFPTEEPLVHRFKVGEIPSAFSFAQEGKFYFPRSGARALEIKTRNLDSVVFKRSRVFSNNVAVMLSEMNNGRVSRQFGSRWGEDLGEVSVTVDAPPDKTATSRIPLDKVLANLDTDDVPVSVQEVAGSEVAGDRLRGVFFVSADAPGVYGDWRLVLQTDLGVVAQWAGASARVFVHDLRTLEPVQGARVTLHSAKNQPLGSASSGADGVAVFDGLNEALGAPSVAVVESADDYTFLKLDARSDDKTNIPRNLPGYAPDRLDAFVYADRELYRPGETVNLRWLVRGGSGASAASIPVEIEVLKPNGAPLMREIRTLSGLGTDECAVATLRDSPTGRYTARLRTPDGPTLGDLTFQVEDFVPQRLRVELEAPARAMSTDREEEVVVRAEHLFGGPAEGRDTELSLNLSRAKFTSERWPGYRFGNDAEWRPKSMELGAVATDGDGLARFRFRPVLSSEVTAPVRARLAASVLEPNGRKNGVAESTFLFPSGPALGLALERTASGEIVARVVAIKPDETPDAELGEVMVELQREEWSYNVRSLHDRSEARWVVKHSTVRSSRVALREGLGEARFELPENYGTWRFLVRAEGRPQFTTHSVSTWGDNSSLDSGGSGRPKLIDLSLDAERYQVGDVAKLRIESPLDGRAFWVVQGAEIFRSGSVEVIDGSAEVELPTTIAESPNAWATATLLHRVQGAAAPTHPLESFAAVPLRVDRPARRLSVEIADAPDLMRPGTTLELDAVALDANGAPAPGAEITVAAVDEGIHSITGYRSPDPYAWLTRLRAPDLRRSHFLDHVEYDYTGPETGGDSEGEASRRIDASGQSWIAPVALWTSVVRADADGRARVSFDIPEDYDGRLRLSAVACTEEAVGSAEQSVLVRRPFILETRQPRLLVEGDAFEASAIVMNRTDRPATARVSWRTRDSLLPLEGERNLELAPNGEGVIACSVQAEPVAGQGWLEWEAVIRDDAGAELERLAKRIALPVRASSTYGVWTETLVMKPGETQAFSLASMVSDARANLEIRAGAVPQLQLERAFNDLVSYPHGCLEQTTSRAMPMLVLYENGHLQGIGDWEKERLREYVEAAVDRLISMQTAKGGLAYWPAGNRPYEYGSVYALHFLTLAGQAGFATPERPMAALRDYARGLAEGPADNPDALHTKAYAMFALALSGEAPDAREVERLDGRELPRSSRLLLAAAMAEVGRDARYAAAISGGPMLANIPIARSGALSSPVRDDAVELLALCRMGGSVEARHRLATRLTAFVAQEGGGNTQENALAITALSRHLRLETPAIEAARAEIETFDGARRIIAGDKLYHEKWSDPDAACTLRNTGDAPIYLTVTRRGVPLQPTERAESSGIGLSRVYLDAQGRRLDEPIFEAGRSYVIELTLNAEHPVDNTIFVDRLPAGLEIDNPRLGSSDVKTAAGNGNAGNRGDAGVGNPIDLYPSYLDMRDDRLIFAVDRLPKGISRYRYAATAVTPGEFQLPAARAECMYDAALSGQTAAAEAVVLKAGR